MIITWNRCSALKTAIIRAFEKLNNMEEGVVLLSIEIVLLGFDVLILGLQLSVLDS